MEMEKLYYEIRGHFAAAEMELREAHLNIDDGEKDRAVTCARQAAVQITAALSLLDQYKP